MNDQSDITVYNNITDSHDEETEQANEVQNYQNEIYNQEKYVEDNQAITLEEHYIEIKERENI